MRKYKSSGMRSLLAGASLILTGVYMQSCFSVTEKISPVYEKAVSTVEQTVNRDIGSVAKNFVEKVEQESHPEKYTVDIANAVAAGGRALNPVMRAREAGIFLTQVPDSLAYEIVRDRAQLMEGAYRQRLLRETFFR